MDVGAWGALSPQKRVKYPVQNKQQVTPKGSAPIKVVWMGSVASHFNGDAMNLK